MERALFVQDRLFTPGPTPTPSIVKEAYLKTDIYHRSKDFEAIVKNCAELLKPLFGTQTTPLILTASGTGAMEAAVTNLTSEGDAVIVFRCGKFGERWQKLCEAYGCHVYAMTLPNGQVPRARHMEEALEKVQRPKAIFFQAHETSTGARLPVEELTSVIKSRAKDALVVVDAISSLGAHTLSMQTMGIDCVVSGSQKGFGVGPGLSFIALSERGWQSLSERPRFYFDLSRERKGQEAGAGRTAFTPAVGLIMGLEAALLEIHKIGVEQFVDHHRRMGEAARAAVQALGLELFVEEVAYSNALTAIKVPDGMDGVRILTTAKTRYGAIISGGQDDLKGKIIRFSHLGFVSPFLLLEGLAALEFALADEGHRFVLGSGVARAMQVLHRH